MHYFCPVLYLENNRYSNLFFRAARTHWRCRRTSSGWREAPKIERRDTFRHQNCTSYLRSIITCIQRSSRLTGLIYRCNNAISHVSSLEYFISDLIAPSQNKAAPFDFCSETSFCQCDSFIIVKLLITHENNKKLSFFFKLMSFIPITVSYCMFGSH